MDLAANQVVGLGSKFKDPCGMQSFLSMKSFTTIFRETSLFTSPSLSAAPHVQPFKEKVLELDESNHAVSFQGIEGGFLKLGFAYYNESFKLDDFGDGKVLAKTTIKYELEKDFDGTQLLEEFTNIIDEYLKSLASYLQKNSAC